MDDIDDDRAPTPEARGIDRRAAMKAALGGAAAAAVLNGPRIDRFSVAPGYAAMATPGCVAPTTTWTHARNPTLGPATSPAGSPRWQAGSGSIGIISGAAAPYTGMGTVHLVEADPPAGTYPNGDLGTATLTSGAMTLTPWSTFTFTFQYRWRDHTTHVAAQRLDAQWARSASGPWTTAWTFTTTVGSGTRDNTFPSTSTTSTGSFGLAITPATSGTYYVRLRHSFVGTIGTSSTQRSNDIAVTTPLTITCV